MVSDLRIHKVIGNLPGDLEPDEIYAVRTGEGFDLYMTDNTGAIAHKLNGGSGGSVQPVLRSPAYVPGKYYDTSVNGLASATLSLVAGRFEVTPGYFQDDFTFDNIGVNVTTSGSPGAWIKLCIYDSDPSGYPDNLLYGTGQISTDVLGFRSENLVAPVTLPGDKIYWCGYQYGSVANTRVSAVNNGGVMPLGFNTVTSLTQITVARQTLAVGDPFPSLWNFASSHLSDGVTPACIRMRAV